MQAFRNTVEGLEFMNHHLPASQLDNSEPFEAEGDTIVPTAECISFEAERAHCCRNSGLYFKALKALRLL